MNFSDRLAVATEVARSAGQLAKNYFDRRDNLDVTAKKSLQDMVTEADQNVETLIRNTLSEAFPADALLGEEHGGTEGSSGLTWVIDPIDGTAPFLAGMPGWCISIGLCDELGPALGVIHAPVLGETYASARGVGATLNGAPIKVSERFTLDTGLVGMGANGLVEAEKVGEMLAALSAAGASWTRYGSGALMLAFVAAGRLVGYVEPRMSAWDCIAGYALIEEAGGKTLPFPLGTDLMRPAPVLASIPADFDRLLDLTRLRDDAHWEKKPT